MARLRHAVSGAVVSVPDSKVERLGSEWVSADSKPAAKKAPATKSPSK